MKSHSTEDDVLVRATARAFFDSKQGLQACGKGYLMTPVSCGAVAWYIRQETESKSSDDFENLHANEDDAANEHDDFQNPGADPFDEESDMPDLTSLLEDQPDCKRFFKVLRSPYSNQQTPEKSQPYVIADLHALIQGRQLQKVQDLLSRVHQLAVHPEDPAYVAEFDRLTTMLQ